MRKIKQVISSKEFLHYMIIMGLNLVISGILFLIFWQVMRMSLAITLAIIIGTSIGFFINNKFPAKIDMLCLWVQKYVQKIINNNSIFRIIIVLDGLMKTVLFMAVLRSEADGAWSYSNIMMNYAPTYFAFILLFYSFTYLLSKKGQNIYLLIMNFIYSLLLIADISYYRTSRDLLSLKQLLYPSSFNLYNESIINFKILDLIFIVDSIIILVIYIIKKIESREKRSFKKFFISIIASMLIISGSVIYYDIYHLSSNWYDTIATIQHNTVVNNNAGGPIAYTLSESLRALMRKSYKLSEQDKKEVEDWFEQNREDLPNNEYFSALKGKNILLIQVESLENFVLNRTVEGNEITPFLNKLVKNSIYCSNFYEENGEALSIDCDFIVNSSIYPSRRYKTGVYYGENTYSSSLPRILKRNGYHTISTHAEDKDNYNWSEFHRCGFNPDEMWSIEDYDYDEKIGYGLSDESFYRQVYDKIQNIKQPFFLQMATLASHGPFDIGDENKTIHFSYKLESTHLGKYFQAVRYADEQLEKFYNKLVESGMMENTALVILGDHSGVHRYYNDELQKLDYEGDWWRNFDHKIPLIIYAEGIKPKEVTVSGGQVDVLPTLSYLLGIDKNEYNKTSMGRVLLNTNRDATIMHTQEIVGNVRNEEEREFILKSYDIGEKIIKSDYMNRE